SSSSSSQEILKDIKAKGFLTMATCTGFEPFEMLVDGKYVGVDVDIAQAIADYIGVDLKVIDMDFDPIVASVQSGKYDLGVAGITANEKRRKNVDFSDDYYKSSQAIIVASDSTIKTVEDVKDKTIGVQKGTTGETYCIENKLAFKSYDNGAAACLALTGKKIDLVIIDGTPAAAHVKASSGALKLLDEPLTKESYAIAVKKGNKELLDTVNLVLKKLKDEGKLKAIFEKYNLVVDED
ncbi:MAG: transporter substrate-binding domain-containing protein, partial [Clostridia bacterium]